MTLSSERSLEGAAGNPMRPPVGPITTVGFQVLGTQPFKELRQAHQMHTGLTATLIPIPDEPYQFLMRSTVIPHESAGNLKLHEIVRIAVSRQSSNISLNLTMSGIDIVSPA